MVGTDDALCVDWRFMDSGDIAGVCRAEIEVLRAGLAWYLYDQERERIFFFGTGVWTAVSSESLKVKSKLAIYPNTTAIVIIIIIIIIIDNYNSQLLSVPQLLSSQP